MLLLHVANFQHLMKTKFGWQELEQSTDTLQETKHQKIF